MKKFRLNYIKHKQQIKESEELNSEFEVFFNLLTENEIIENKTPSLSNWVLCKCGSKLPPIKTDEFIVCPCGICLEEVGTTATDLDMKNRDVKKKYMSTGMEYFNRRMRQIESLQAVDFPFKIKDVIDNCEDNVTSVLDWLKREGYCKTHRKNIYLIMNLAFGYVIRLPVELKRDLTVLFSRFIEFYYDYKVNKKKIIPFNYLMKEFTLIISQVRNKSEYRQFIFITKRQKLIKNHQKNRIVFNSFKKNLIESYKIYVRNESRTQNILLTYTQ